MAIMPIFLWHVLDVIPVGARLNMSIKNILRLVLITGLFGLLPSAQAYKQDYETECKIEHKLPPGRYFSLESMRRADGVFMQKVYDIDSRGIITASYCCADDAKPEPPRISLEAVTQDGPPVAVLHHDKHRSRIVQGIKGFIHKVTNTLAGNRN